MLKLNKVKSIITAVITALILAASLLPGLPNSILAQGTGQGLEISPPLLDQKVDPGQSIILNIRLRNITRSTLVARGRIDDFVAAGEDGQPKLITEEDAEPSPFSFKDWVADIQPVTLVAGEAKSLNIKINVPDDASPGGHYGVIRFTGTPPEIEDTGVSLSASIGTLVLLNVSGPVTEQLTFAEFFTSQRGNKGTFFEYSPITFVERFQNNGNVHLKPTGDLKVTNVFGQEIANLPINKVERGGNVLPASIRKFEQSLEGKTMIGRYKATATVTYGDGKTLSQSLNFWVLPYKLIAAILLGIVLLFFIIRMSMRGYRRRIIKQHTNV